MTKAPILLFGAAGQLGTALTEAAARQASGLIGLDRSAADITEAGAVSAALDRHRPRMAVNAAAFTAVDRAETDVAAATAVNSRAPKLLAGAAASRGIPLIHVSTDYVFDGEKRGAYVESDPVNPLSAYGRTKADGEARIREAWKEHVIVRTAWLFGRSGSNFVKTVLKLVQDRRPIRAATDQRGSPTSADDLALAILAVVEALDAGRAVFGTYHFAGAGSASRFEYACAVVHARAEIMGPGPEVLPALARDFPAAAARPANSALDSTRFARTFALEPRPWREGVRDTVQAIVGDERLRARETSIA